MQLLQNFVARGQHHKTLSAIATQRGFYSIRLCWPLRQVLRNTFYARETYIRPVFRPDDTKYLFTTTLGWIQFYDPLARLADYFILFGILNHSETTTYRDINYRCMKYTTYDIFHGLHDMYVGEDRLGAIQCV